MPLGGTNLCTGGQRKSLNYYDALIITEKIKNDNRTLLVMIQYENDIKEG